MNIQLHDKTFEPFINETQIKTAIQKVVDEILKDYQQETPLFLGILNGAFIFCADLLKNYNSNCEISFLKLASYEQTSSTGIVNELIGLNQDITGRTVIILEDIVDTGTTLEKIISLLKTHQAKNIKTATLFLKPAVYNKSIPIDYVGMEIPNKFIVGYGLDYDGLGRNLSEVYVLKEE